MIKILVTSVGSLVGQNILDALESRRKYVTIVGLNSIAESQRMYRCERAYLVPQTNSPDFKASFENIVQKENPDLILAGRDEDAVFLAHYNQKKKDVKYLIPAGEPFIAEMMIDKFLTHQYAEKHNLPYAATFLYKDSSDYDELTNFIAEYEFPLLVKPRKGFGSIGVYLLINQSQVDNLISESDEVMFQEYLAPDKDLNLLQKQITKGIPLSFQVPNHDHISSQALISRDGRILDYMSTLQTMVMGRTEYACFYDEPSLNQLIEDYADSVAQNGWWGFLNIQCGRDRFGNWKVFELNPRCSGGTSARLNLGLDELGLILNDEKPEWNFPLEVIQSRKENHVFKYLIDHCVADSDVKKFRTEGYWEK